MGMETRHPCWNRAVGLQIQPEVRVAPPVLIAAVVKLQEQMQAQALPSAMPMRSGPDGHRGCSATEGQRPTLPRLLSGWGGASETSPCPTSQLVRFLFRHRFLLQGAQNSEGDPHYLSHPQRHTAMTIHLRGPL